MSDVTVDSLQIEIEASSEKAVEKLNTLTEALRGLQSATQGKFGDVQRQIREIGEAAQRTGAGGVREKIQEKREALKRSTSSATDDNTLVVRAGRQLNTLDSQIEKTKNKILELEHSLQIYNAARNKNDFAEAIAAANKKLEEQKLLLEALQKERTKQEAILRGGGEKEPERPRNSSFYEQFLPKAEEISRAVESAKSKYSELIQYLDQNRGSITRDVAGEVISEITAEQKNLEKILDRLGDRPVPDELYSALDALKHAEAQFQEIWANPAPQQINMDAVRRQTESFRQNMPPESDAIERTKAQLKSLQQAIKDLDRGKLQLTSELSRAEIQAVRTEGKLADLRRKLDDLNAKGAGSIAQEALGDAEAKFAAFSEAAEESRKRVEDLRHELEVLRNYRPDLSMPNIEEDIRAASAELRDMIQAYRDSSNAAKLAGEEMKNSMAEVNAAMREGGVEHDTFDPIVSRVEKLTSALKNLVSSGIGKAVSGLKSIGKYVISDFTRPFQTAIKAVAKWKNAIGRLVFYRMTRAAIKAVTDGFKTGMENLYQYSKMVGTEFAPAMNSLATSALYLKNSLGAMAAPLVQALAPAIDFLIDKFVALINVIGKAFAMLTGKSVYTQAKKHAVEYGEAANSASKATKDFLLGIDELNILNDSAGGGGGAASDFGSMFEEVEIDQDQFDWVKQIREAIENGEWRSVGELVAEKLNEVVESWDSYAWGQKLGGLINNGLNVAYGFLNTFDFKQLGGKVADGLNGIFDEVDWGLLGHTFAAKLNALFDLIYGFITKFHWDVFGKAIAEAIIGFFSEINWGRIIDILQAGIEAVRQALVGFLSEFGEQLDIQGITDPLIEIVNTVYGTLQQLIEDTKKWLGQLDFTPLITSFENLLGAISPLVSTISDGLLWAYKNVLLPFGKWTIEEALPAAINLLASAFGFLSEVLEKLSPTAQFIISDIITPLASAAWDVISTAVEGVTNAFQKFTDLLSGDTSFSDFLSSLAPGEALILGIATALGVAKAAYLAVGTAVTVFNTAATALKITLAALNSPVGLVVTAIGLLAAGFVELYKHSEGFRNFIDGVIEGAKNLLPGIIKGIQDGWNAFIETLTGFWDWIVQGFKDFFGIHSPSTVFADLGGNLIEGLLDGIKGAWDSIVQFFQSAFGPIADAIGKAWDWINGDTELKLVEMSTIANDTVSGMKTGMDKTMGEIVGTVEQAWKDTNTNTNTEWSNITRDLNNSLDGINTDVNTQFDTVKTAITTAWDNARKDTFGAFEDMKTDIHEKTGEIQTQATTDFKGVADNIRSPIDDVVKDAKSWGEDICKNLSDGMEGIGKGLVAGAATGLAESIRARLHFSEPDVGPLSDFHTYMPDMLDLMSRGIKDNTYKAVGAANELAGKMSQALGNIGPVEPKFSSLPTLQLSGSYSNAQAGGNSISSYSPHSVQGNDNSDVIAALNAGFQALIETINSQDYGTHLDGRTLMQSVERAQRQRGANIMGGGILG